MFYIVNPSQIVVEIDDYSFYQELLSQRGFREATDEEIFNFQEKHLRIASDNSESDSDLIEWILLAINNSTNIERVARIRNLLERLK
jgi:hypothetical protein